MLSGDPLSAVTCNTTSLPWRFLAHAFTTGTAIVSLGMISGLTCSILALKFHSKLHSNEYNEKLPHEDSRTEEKSEGEEDQQDSIPKHSSTFIFQRSHILPLESMGLSYNSNYFISSLGSMFQRATPFILHLSGSVNDVFLTSVICFPIGFYYFTWISLANIYPQVQGNTGIQLLSDLLKLCKIKCFMSFLY